MTSIGYPDGQRITQWLGAVIVKATALAIGNVLHTDGPFNLASWASVIVAVKPTGGNVTVKVRQRISGDTSGMETSTTFVVAAGQTTFESVVLFGDVVYLDLTGSAVGVVVDYAFFPSNTTTNAQVLASAIINFQKNDALVAAESAIDFMDKAGQITWLVVDDAPGLRVRVTPQLANPLLAPGDVHANYPGANAMRMASNQALYFDSGGTHYIYLSSPTSLTTADRFTSAGMDVHRHPYGQLRHIESGLMTVPAGGPGASVAFTSAFGSNPNVVCASNANTVPVAIYSATTTTLSLYHASGATVAAYWIAEGQG